MIGITLYNVIKKNIGMGGSKPRAYCGMKSGAWCNAYVCYGFNQAGAKNLYYGGKKVTYCPTSIKWCQANLAQIPMYWAMAGDVIYFDWNANNVPDHIGFVKSKISSASISTHEGNTNGGVVAEKARPYKYVLGVFRPLYNPTCSKAKLVVDGEFGYQSIYMLQCALGMSNPNGILNKATVKALQKKVGVAQDGAIGRKTAIALQKFLKVKQDGAIGKDTTVALQKWINAVCYPNTSSGSTATKPTTPAPSTPTTKGYTGTFPDLVTHTGQKITQTAKELAWAKGTKKSIYTYPKGKATAAFTKAINKVYPKRSSWSAQCRAGASCDVGAGTIIRLSGADASVPRGLSEQLPHFKKSSLWKNTGLTKCQKAGDVAMQPSPNAHIWIGLGNGDIAEANHTWKFFEHIVKDTRKINGKANSGVYRATKATVIQKGDKGTEVVKMQNYLNWFGNYALKPDGEYGAQTELALKDFQKKTGLQVDGACGNKTLEKMKSYKKSTSTTPK